MADTTKSERTSSSSQPEQAESTEVVRREPAQRSARPIEVLRELMRLDPFGAMVPLVTRERMWSPDFEVRETRDSYVFKADLPGASKDDIEISLVGNRMHVTGRREEEEETEGDTYYACERSYGSFTRTFTLPDTADTEHVSSELRDGVLTLVIPKAAQARARKIQIGPGEKH